MTKEKELHGYYTGLRTKFMVIIFFIAFIPLILLGGTTYYYYSTTVKEKIGNELKLITKNRKDTIDLFLNDRANSLSVLAYTHRFDYIEKKENLHNVFQLSKMVCSAFQDMGIINSDGEQVAYIGPYHLSGKQYSSAEWFQEVMKKDVYISNVFLGFRKVPHFIIAVKRMEDGKPWILRVTIDINKINHFMSTALLGKGGGDSYILSREGVYQTGGVEDDRILTKSDFKIPSVFRGVEETEKRREDKAVLCASTWLKNNDWLMVIEQDLKHELGPVVHVKNTVLLIFVISSFIIVISTILITKRVFVRLEKIGMEKLHLSEQLVRSDRLAAIGKLASGIAHEINNPLAVISEKAGWIGDLLTEEDVKNSPNYDELIQSTEDIKKHVKRGKKVISRLMGFARKEGIEYQKVDINSVLDETYDFLNKKAMFQNIAIMKEFQDDLPNIVTDGAQLQQVFINIVNNAIDAINKDGMIRLITKRQGGGVLITIADTGPGMPEEVQKKIFDPFFTTKQIGKGTGLGLSTSYGIIEKLCGQLTVESEVGNGTTFYITLPPSCKQ
ncbi:MAG: GHKL domain-containing protein [Deltaproteobacteria bacterium]|nr:GHKL domain-containing protein [Deltaproteobacteria bacterium]MBW2661912.1 GHKL domain-containing protein [Deltaproteobacteria bacterium]